MAYDYIKSTYDHPNPLVRFSHRSRLKYNSLFFENNIEGKRILDFGCGKGKFLDLLSNKYEAQLVGFEPKMEVIYNPKINFFQI